MTLSVAQIEAYRSPLVCLLSGYVHDDAEDLAQEVLTRLWLGPRDCTLNFALWRARMDALSALRRHRPIAEIAESVMAPEQPEPLARLLEAASLTRDEQTIADAACGGFTRSQIAEHFALSPAGLTAALGRIRKKLVRYYLRERGDL